MIGREFARRLLERSPRSDGEEPTDDFEELKAIEPIHQTATLPELAYMFKHALTQDVAYKPVVLERRNELHRPIGLAIEELYADRLAEYCEMLAHHFSKAEACGTRRSTILPIVGSEGGQLPLPVREALAPLRPRPWPSPIG